jgi:hypothetical protein
MNPKKFLSMLVLALALVAGTASAQTGSTGTTSGTGGGTTGTTPGTPNTGLGGDSAAALSMLLASGIGAVAGALYLKRRLS